MSRFEMYEAARWGWTAERGGRKERSSASRILHLMHGFWFVVVVPYVDWWVRGLMYMDAVWFWPCVDELSMSLVPHVHTPASWPFCNNSAMEMYCVSIWPRPYIHRIHTGTNVHKSAWQFNLIWRHTNYQLQGQLYNTSCSMLGIS